MIKTIHNLCRHPEFRRYGGNTMWLLAERFIPTAAVFIAGIYVARALGPEDFGLLNFAFSFVLLFTFLLTMGIDNIAVRELVRRPECRDKILGSMTVMRLAGFLLMLFFILLTLVLYPQSAKTQSVIWLVAGGHFGMVFYGVDFYYQANIRVKYSSLSIIGGAVFAASLNIWGACRGYGVTYFGAVTAAGIIMTGLFKLLSYQFSEGSIARWNIDAGEIKYLFKETMPLMLQTFLGLLQLQIGFFAVKSMLSADELGYYSLAARLSAYFVYLPEILCTSFFPGVIAAGGRDRKAYGSGIRRLALALLAMGALATLVCLLFAPGIVSMLYGKDYLAGGKILAIISLAFPFYALWVLVYRYMINEKQQKFILTLGVFTAVAAVGTNLLLVKQFGLKGAAYAVIIAAAAAFVILPFNAKFRQFLRYLYLI